VTHCVDLVTGLVSAGDVGEFGATWDRLVLGEVQVERSFAGPRFVAVTVVTAKGMGHLMFSLSGSHDHESPADIGHGTAGTGLAILVTSGTARSAGFTLLRGLRRAGIQGCRWAATRWRCPQRADLRGRRDDPRRHPEHVAESDTLIHSTRRPDPACLVIHGNKCAAPAHTRTRAAGRGRSPRIRKENTL